MTSELQRPSLADQVYERLIAAVVSGAMPSGSPLNVGDLARELKVSPSPVRDALQRMASEGLVTSTKCAGADWTGSSCGRRSHWVCV